MAIRKIVRIEKSSEDDGSYRGGLFSIWYTDTADNEYRYDVHKLEHDRLMFEQDMLRRGISEADIEKYKELLEAELHEEVDFNGCVNCG